MLYERNGVVFVESREALRSYHGTACVAYIFTGPDKGAVYADPCGDTDSDTWERQPDPDLFCRLWFGTYSKEMPADTPLS